MRGKLGVEILGGHTVGDPECGIDRGEHELESEAGKDGAIDDRGVHRALYDRRAAQVAQGKARDVIAL